MLTTPGLLAEAGAAADGRELLGKICQATGLPVLASVSTVRSTDVYREGRELAKLSDQIEVAIPFVEDSIGAVGRLRTDGVRALLPPSRRGRRSDSPAKAGAYGVSAPSIAAPQRQDGADAVRDIVAVLRDTGGASSATRSPRFRSTRRNRALCEGRARRHCGAPDGCDRS